MDKTESEAGVWIQLKGAGSKERTVVWRGILYTLEDASRAHENGRHKKSAPSSSDQIVEHSSTT